MKTLSIGRNQECDLTIDNSAVSRRHALLRIHPSGKYDIISNGSNGTKVNGNEIASNVPYPIKRGDSVIFANAARLDWKRVPNPLKPLRIAVICVLAAICLGMAIWGITALTGSSESGSDDVTEEQVDVCDATPAPAPPAEKLPSKDFLNEQHDGNEKQQQKSPSGSGKASKKPQKTKPAEPEPEESPIIDMH